MAVRYAPNTSRISGSSRNTMPTARKGREVQTPSTSREGINRIRE
jgi:hypothetical protein